MANVLVVYASGYGQSERIAQRIATVLGEGGHRAVLRSVDAPGVAAAIGEADAVVLGGSIRRGRHARALEIAAAGNAAAIAARPNAFFSVSLSAAGTAEQVANARRCVDKFIARTHWQPGGIALFGGALPYSKYNPWLRLVMRFIVRMAHGDTDASRDYDYTDWAAVERFARDFAVTLRTAIAA
jgi:menaquinone-dependent protoporphyrinogen oxidase